MRSGMTGGGKVFYVFVGIWLLINLVLLLVDWYWRHWGKIKMYP